MARCLLLLLTACILSWAAVGRCDPGDTTVVHTFVEEFQNWADPHVATFVFPPATMEFNQAWLHIELGCPAAPGDCDPWDRTAILSVRRPRDGETESVEIARYITPYDITGGNRPGTCGWDYEMLDYLPLLHDSVTLASYIESFIGGNMGWLVTATFYFVEGDLPMRPYQVENAWAVGYLGIGNPADPPESHLPTAAIPTQENTAAVTMRVVTTGHGQGNTMNAAEFSRLAHGVWVGDNYFEHVLWRTDCSTNPCSPQGGTWQYARAGWCPGAKVDPWDNTAISFVPGSPLAVQAVIEDYENFCRPDNPDCISGQTCTDCNYNSTGHTAPNYNTVGQVILWRSTGSAAPTPPAPFATDFRLEENFPNPFNATTTIRFGLPGTGWTRLTVFDLSGRRVASLIDQPLSTGLHSIVFDAAHLPSGVYLTRLEFGGRILARKLLLLK